MRRCLACLVGGSICGITTALILGAGLLLFGPDMPDLINF